MYSRLGEVSGGGAWPRPTSHTHRLTESDREVLGDIDSRFSNCQNMILMDVIERNIKIPFLSICVRKKKKSHT